MTLTGKFSHSQNFQNIFPRDCGVCWARARSARRGQGLPRPLTLTGCAALYSTGQAGWVLLHVLRCCQLAASATRSTAPARSLLPPFNFNCGASENFQPTYQQVGEYSLRIVD